MKRRATLFVAILLYTITATGQPRGPMRDAPSDLPPFVFLDAVNLMSTDSSKSRLDIIFRIDQNFFIAVRDKNPELPAGFVLRGEVLIELFDSVGVSKARSIQRVEIPTDRSDTEVPETKWYQSIASFEVPPGPYKIVFELDDLESERRFIDNNTMVLLKAFRRGSGDVSTPMFIDWTHETAALSGITPIGFGPHLLFGRKAALYLEVPSGDAVETKAWVEYRISTSPLHNKTATLVLAETLASPITRVHAKLDRVKTNNPVEYSVTSNDSSKALGLIIPIGSDRLPLRRFDLAMTIRVGNEEYTTTKSFQMVWPDMPFSLRDIDYAITAMKYITTDDQRDSLQRGDLERRRDNLEAFWKRRDTTPATAYNEVMVEYYRRVDHATKSFGTLREPDGFKSDRGRAYILYGPPTRTERALSSSEGYQEMWIYEALGKRFIFADQNKTGNYVLVSTQSL